MNSIDLYCVKSGVFLGNLTLAETHGTLPWLLSWSEAQTVHPYFSLPPNKLLAFSRNEYRRWKQERQKSSEESLCILFVALLENVMDCLVIRDSLELEDLWPHLVKHFPRLIECCYWKWQLDSQRFAFPRYVVSEVSGTTKLQTIGGFLEACMDTIREYESRVRESESKERERLLALAAARKNLRSTFTKDNFSPKILWRWMVHHIPPRYHGDIEWMERIWFLHNDKFDTVPEKDIKLMEEILEECFPVEDILASDDGEKNPAILVHAIRQRLEKIRTSYDNLLRSFEVLDSAYRVHEQHAGKTLEQVAAEQPKLEMFKSKIEFMIATAKWKQSMQALSVPGASSSSSSSSTSEQGV